MRFAGRGFKLNGQFVFNLIDQALPNWTLVLNLDPNFMISDPGFIAVTGFITSRQVPMVPQSYIAGSMNK